MNKTNLRRLYDKTINASIKFHDYKLKLDKAISETFGTHYSEHNEDFLIDAIDYGYGCADFDMFFEIMTNLKEKTNDS